MWLIETRGGNVSFKRELLKQELVYGCMVVLIAKPYFERVHIYA
jgi:hypothetical protein